MLMVGWNTMGSGMNSATNVLALQLRCAFQAALIARGSLKSVAEL